MSVTIADHLFALLLAVPLPILGAWQYRRLRSRLDAGKADARVRHYRSLIVEELLVAGAAIALWLASGRPWDALAPATPEAWTWAGWAGWAAAAAISALLVVQAAALRRDEDLLADARRQLAPVAAFLPRTAREHRIFQALAVTAGVAEEVVFRGFAMAWCAALASGPLGLGPGAALGFAVLASSALFGLAHAYQGSSGMARTAAVGVVLAGLAAATGGLLAPMAVHALVDVTSGLVARRAFRAKPLDGVPGPEAAGGTP